MKISYDVSCHVNMNYLAFVQIMAIKKLVREDLHQVT